MANRLPTRLSAPRRPNETNCEKAASIRKSDARYRAQKIRVRLVRHSAALSVPPVPWLLRFRGSFGSVGIALAYLLLAKEVAAPPPVTDGTR